MDPVGFSFWPKPARGRGQIAPYIIECRLCCILAAQAQHFARFRRRRYVAAQRRNDPGRLLDKGGIARSETAALQIEIVFQAYPHMTAKQQRLRDHGELMQADAEGEPCAAGRQKIAHIDHRFACCRRTAGYAEAYLDQRRDLHMAGGYELAGQDDMTGIKHLEFGQNPCIPDRHRHFLHMRHGIDEDETPHIHAAEVEAADLRFQFDHMADALARRGQGRGGVANPADSTDRERNARRRRLSD